MAALEDTFRMMKCEKPVNTHRLTEEDKDFHENREKFQQKAGAKITKDLLADIKGSLSEMRGGPEYKPQDIAEKYDELVDNAKVLTALLSKINRDRLDERVLSSVDSDLKNLASHLAEYPQFRPIIEKRIK